MTKNEEALERLLEEETRRSGVVTDHLFNRIKQLEAEAEAQVAHIKDLMAKLEDSNTTLKADLSYQRKLEGVVDGIRKWAAAWEPTRSPFPTEFASGYFSAMDSVLSIIKNKLED